ncbi:MAG: LptA/OstA family protein [Pseudomonadota bacterium]
MTLRALHTVNRLARACVLLAIATATPTLAHAQVSGKAFEGFRGNSKNPIQIEADRLEVVDSKAMAVFAGNVKVRQGSSTITTSKLIVRYKRGGGGQQDIDRLELSGGLVVVSSQNTATADSGVYEVANENITLSGNVVLSQGSSVAKGCKLRANLKTNVAKLDSCGGRVKSVFTPNRN